MNFAESQRNPGKHPTGLLIVIAAHVLLAYFLLVVLGKRDVDKVNVTETQAVDAPPPPPTPPPPAVERHVEATAAPAPPGPAPVARAAVIRADDPSCRPEYPAAALRANATGVSHIRFTVDASGKVTAAEVLGSSGPTREHRLLDNAAKAALASCPIKVGTDAEGHPVGTQTEVVYTWKLD